MSNQESLEQYKSNLNLIKSMTGDKAEEQFYQLMEKTKNTFGDMSLHMGEFYFQYAKFLIQKMEKNIDIFNAGALPVGNNQEEREPIPEDMYEDDSSGQSNSEEAPKSQNNVNHANNQNGQNNGHNPTQNNHPQPTQNNQPQITQNNPKQPTIPSQPQAQPQPNQNEANQAEDDDYQICADNLLCAIKIFQNERNRIKQGGEQQVYSLSQINKWISRCKSRLGDLHHLNQNYTQAVNVYREVVEDEEKKLGHEANRGLAEIHYMIANSFLYQNKEGCQKIAIKQFIKSVQILLNHLNQLHPQDTTYYQMPTQQKVKVDRFAYLPKSTDTQQTKQIKQVISCLLDKIQDTNEQISVRIQYQQQKLKNKQEQQNSQFKQVSPNVNVVKLGTFGNRKKKAEEIPEEELKKRNS